VAVCTSGIVGCDTQPCESMYSVLLNISRMLYAVIQSSGKDKGVPLFPGFRISSTRPCIGTNNLFLSVLQAKKIISDNGRLLTNL